MATAPYASSASAPMPYRAANYAPPVAANSAPPGTFAPGTKVQVGSHRVIIEKYLSEGGFAHVYVVRVPRDGDKHEVAVLKRVAVPDKDALANMRTEVETMKKLKGHRKIVTYIDSHASQMKGGGYEVFLLMEFCAGGGLIDFMNTRLQHRLTEPEILKIFGDVSEGVATMHYLRPPLLHRDLKVENVLISKPPTSPSGVEYKLCDFGSTAPPRPAATNASEARLIEEDIQKHTTMQYRSPEMVDVWRKQPIDEKSDIWALGVLLYKLCYYTTPFEEVGQMAILNASFKYPPYPAFSDRIKRLIGSMLREDPKQRPNIYQVIKEVCSMRGVPVPIKDIYVGRTQSEARNNQKLPSREPSVASPPPVGIHKSPPVERVQAIPEITPMRRGRPAGPTQVAGAAKPSPSPARGDPFAALDSSNLQVRAGAVEELSKCFPSLDDFSITHDTSKFGKPSVPKKEQPGLDQRLTNALADEVFAQTKPAQPSRSPQPPSTERQQQTVKTTAQAASTRKPDVPGSRPDSAKQSPVIQQPAPVRPGYSSTGTMTSPAPTPPAQARPAEVKMPEIRRPIWRVPSHHRSSSQPRASPAAQSQASTLRPTSLYRPAMLDLGRSKSQANILTLNQSPASSRPSLEGHRPSDSDFNESIKRTTSASKARPVSAAYVESNLDFLRESESQSKRPSLDFRRPSRQASGTSVEDETAIDETHIENDADYLRSIEGGDLRGKPSRKSSSHKKRSSMPSISLKGTKLFAGKVGDAFRRFEISSDSDKADSDRKPDLPQPLRTPSPQLAGLDDKRLLSPISGSEATATPPRRADDGAAEIEETEELPPEVRRELERRQLLEEERRVAQAAEDYRNRSSNTGPPSRASTIQKRVQSLLEEGRQSPQPKRTAEGYGHYTERRPESPVKGPPPQIARKPQPAELSYGKTRQVQPPAATVPVISSSAPPAAAPAPAQQQPKAFSKPNAPPKPKAFKTGTPQLPQTQPPPSFSAERTQPMYTGRGRGPGLAALLARDQEGVAAAGAGNGTGHGPEYGSVSNPPASAGHSQRQMDGAEPDTRDLEAEFAKRYPSLNAIEMVETEIVARDAPGSGARRGMRVKEV